MRSNYRRASLTHTRAAFSAQKVPTRPRPNFLEAQFPAPSGDYAGHYIYAAFNVVNILDGDVPGSETQKQATDA
jgi:hypothetical protein